MKRAFQKKSLELANWLTWRADIANKQTDRQTGRREWKESRVKIICNFVNSIFMLYFFHLPLCESEKAIFKKIGVIRNTWNTLKLNKNSRYIISIIFKTNVTDLNFSFLKHDKRAIIQKRFYFSPLVFYFQSDLFLS